MLLKCTRFVSWSIIFGLLMGVLGTLSFFVIGSFYDLLLDADDLDLGGLLLASGYVFAYCAVTCLLAFILSGFFSGKLSKWSGYIFLILAATPIQFINFHLVIFIASLLTVYFGERIYRKVWSRIEITSTR